MQALDMTNVYAFHAYNDARAESALATGKVPSRNGRDNPFVQDPTSAENVERFRDAVDKRTKTVVEAQPHLSADALDRWYAKDKAQRDGMAQQGVSLHMHEMPQLEDFKAKQALRLQAILPDLTIPTKVAMAMHDANPTPATPDTTAAAKTKDDRRMDDMVAAVASSPAARDAVRDRARGYVRNIEPIGSANAGSDRSHTPTRNKSDYALDI